MLDVLSHNSLPFILKVPHLTVNTYPHYAVMTLFQSRFRPKVLIQTTVLDPECKIWDHTEHFPPVRLLFSFFEISRVFACQFHHPRQSGGNRSRAVFRGEPKAHKILHSQITMSVYAQGMKTKTDELMQSDLRNRQPGFHKRLQQLSQDRNIAPGL